MADVESGGLSGETKAFSLNLVVRTVYHAVYFVGDNFVLAWGLYIWYHIGERDLEHPLLHNLKYLAPAFFTNWNFVSFELDIFY
ncbi:unnamed protein product [Leptosia nina]|uniref:Uncharacterized protein n=1 Tax=Leptosia nina TaxID=320188 RepID=A0AAV1JHI3_9NEOP